jgi:hypothetical protein
VIHGLNGDEVEDGFVVVHVKTNGRWELRSLMKHDERVDMGCLVPMKKKAH